MKASRKSSQFATPGSFQPDPLTVEQQNAIDLLIQGKSDQDVADLIGKARETVWRWKTRVPHFMAILECRRQEQFGQAAQRLRNLLDKALENVATAVQEGNLKASFEVIRATGLAALPPPTGETNVETIAQRIMLEILSREGIPERSFDLSHLDRNPAYDQRQQELLDALARGDAID